MKRQLKSTILNFEISEPQNSRKTQEQHWTGDCKLEIPWLSELARLSLAEGKWTEVPLRENLAHWQRSGPSIGTNLELTLNPKI